jgi:hypothetical protein
MANDYSTSTDTFADISEGNYSSSDYPQMASFVTVASRLIDAEMGRGEGFFYPSTDDATYYYNGSGTQELNIDEFVSITSVSVSEQGGLSSSDYTIWTLNTDYLTAPYNAANKGKPINKLIIAQIPTTKAVWFSYQKSVKVVGVAGYSTTPPDLVKQACKVQAVRWFMRAKGGYQDVTGNDDIGKLYYKGETHLDSDVKAMLWPFKLELDR